MKLLTAIVVLAFTQTVMAQAQKTPTYRLAVFPFTSAFNIPAFLGPTTQRLAAETGEAIKLIPQDSYRSFLRGMDKGLFDIVVMQPNQLSRPETSNYIPIAITERPIRAIFVVHANSRFQSIDQLKGQKIAMPPKADQLTQLAIDALDKHVLSTPSQLLPQVGSSFRCMEWVLFKKATACVTSETAFQLMAPKHTNKLRIIYKTDAAPLAIFAVHRDMAVTTQAKILSSVLTWNDEPDKQQRALNVGSFIPFDKKLHGHPETTAR